MLVWLVMVVLLVVTVGSSCQVDSPEGAVVGLIFSLTSPSPASSSSPSDMSRTDCRLVEEGKFDFRLLHGWWWWPLSLGFSFFHLVRRFWNHIFTYEERTIPNSKALSTAQTRLLVACYRCENSQRNQLPRFDKLESTGYVCLTRNCVFHAFGTLPAAINVSYWVAPLHY